jgi:catechol 2,3-dioxygenase-like lactoylglutathione lyase family enzyme
MGSLSTVGHTTVKGQGAFYSKSNLQSPVSMPITGLFHIAIKTADLDTTVAFYTQLMELQEVTRPDFGFPGAWLACPTPTQPAIIHLYAGGPALGTTGSVPLGSAAIDHLSLTATGFHAFRQRLRAAGIPWREFIVPGTDLWQLFVYDPNGVMLELTFLGTAEGSPVPDLSPGRAYEAGSSFFDPQVYQSLKKSSCSPP